MNNNYDKIEEDLKKKLAEEKKKEPKVSGKSVFKLQEIIKEKAKTDSKPIKKENRS
ncbi:MAG: hypothetical protein US94_C0037G0010 [Berkelbacteria bacterium GW2011_GWB1_38_5]|uniref:Uncharacterized protein n=1 Tax=Berkelbacteria bacterium GW2011_GWB1_38_5 TaxID=1618336 RepID=A0A0G0N7U5_9BACT|nr:MAG: hypothetical protein US94_C0037G0010 [Berkelbacteria bacterium GW2011_GWB1_38_5]